MNYVYLAVKDCPDCKDESPVVCLTLRVDFTEGERKWYTECPCECHSIVVYDPQV